MRIDNSYLSGLSAAELRGNAEAGEAGQKSEIKPEKPAALPLHVPSAELDNLRQLLQDTPDIRPEIMERVAPLYQSGYYATPEAAEKTADTMIQEIA